MAMNMVRSPIQSYFTATNFTAKNDKLKTGYKLL